LTQQPRDIDKTRGFLFVYQSQKKKEKRNYGNNNNTNQNETIFKATARWQRLDHKLNNLKKEL